MPTEIKNVNKPDSIKDKAYASISNRISKRITAKDSRRIITAFSGKQNEPNRGQGTERRPSVPRSHTTGPMREDAVGMSVGGGDPAHVTNPTDNYAAQRKRALRTKILRRKPPKMM